jgi:uncharacterized damage-inducible protein DinB
MVTMSVSTDFAYLPLPEPSLDLIRWLFNFSDWTGRQTSQAIAKATIEQLSEPGVIAGGHGDGSLLAAYAHLVGAEAFWFGRWTHTLHLPYPDDLDESSLPSLNRLWARVTADRAAWLAQLTAADLTADYMELQGDEGGPRVAPLWPALVHVAFHSAHHRAEIYEALTKFGCPPAAEPDMIDFTYGVLGGVPPSGVRVLDQFAPS